MGWLSHGLWAGGWDGEFQITREGAAFSGGYAGLSDSHKWFLT